MQLVPVIAEVVSLNLAHGSSLSVTWAGHGFSLDCYDIAEITIMLTVLKNCSKFK